MKTKTENDLINEANEAIQSGEHPGTMGALLAGQIHLHERLSKLEEAQRNRVPPAIPPFVPPTDPHSLA